VRSRDELEKAFIATTKDHARGLVVLPGILFTTNQNESRSFQSRADCRRFTGKASLPKRVAFWAYGPSLPDQFRRIGVLAGKILRGSKPAEIPVEQPTKYELVVNLTTAKQIGLTIPQSVLYRTDKVIK
jgi:putative tryptophan/tyrosine transport system substrate-binding protein